jgi:hypothetical protein
MVKNLECKLMEIPQKEKVDIQLNRSSAVPFCYSMTSVMLSADTSAFGHDSPPWE